MAIDTLKVAKRLREAGFTEPQTEAVIATVQEAAEGAGFATKEDLGEARTELKADIAALKADIAAVRSALRESEPRLEARIEAIKADILNRVLGLILGALVVNIV